MFAIEEGLQKINGELVETFQREVVCGNTDLEVEARTTGYKGGCCRNAGGRTYISLLCLNGDFFFGPIKDDEGRFAGITISIRDLDLLTVGLVNDMYIESDNDDQNYAQIGTQAEMDAF